MHNFIFDVDGTLIDSEKMYLLPLHKTLVENGYDIQYESLKKVFGITAVDSLKILGVKNVQKVLKEWFSKIQDYKKYATVYDGIYDTLEGLHQDKNNRLAIATSKIESEFHRDVARFGLDKYFNAYVFSNEIKHGKPAPDMVYKGIEKLHADPKQTIYIGDTIYDLQAAHAAKVAFGLAGWRTKKSDEFKEAEYYLVQPSDLLDIND